MNNSNTTRSAWRITTSLFVAQSLSSAGIIAIFTVLSILGAELAGSAQYAGYPSMVINYSSAIAAYVFGFLWERIGRRAGLALGVFLGVLGIGISGTAVLNGSFSVLLFGMIGLGFARAALKLSRFVAAEVHQPAKRGMAISLVVWGGTVGAVLGPLLTSPVGRLAEQAGYPEALGLFALGGLMLIVTLLTIVIGVRPEPAVLSKQIIAENGEEQTDSVNRPISVILRQPAVIAAVMAMLIGQMVMVMIMGMTPLYMKDLGYGLESISPVLSAHTLGMFAFAVLSGYLVDRWGKSPVIYIGIAILISSFAIAPLNTSVLNLGLALFLLGLGWNFSFVGGSALLADQLVPGERSRVQGINDMIVALAAGSGNLIAGLLYETQGYGILNAVSAGLTAGLLVIILWWQINARRKQALLQSSN